MGQDEIFFHPGNEVILERAFDDLVKQIRRQELIDICARKVGGEWLAGMVNITVAAQHSVNDIL